MATIIRDAPALRAISRREGKISGNHPLDEAVISGTALTKEATSMGLTDLKL